MAVSTQAVVQGVTALVTGLVYAYVARLILTRPTSREAHRANAAFAVWWGALGSVQLLAGLYGLQAAAGVRDLALAVTLVNLLLVLIAVAFAALLYFLVYLYTGSRRAFWPIVAAYAVLAVGLLYLVAWMRPTGFDEASATAALTYERRLEGPPAIALGLVFSVPIIAAAVAYGSLFFRTHEPAQRYRIAVVAGSFLGWFGWSAVSTVLELARRYPDSLGLRAVNAVVALVVPLLIVAAYRPPRWVSRRLWGARAEEAS